MGERRKINTKKEIPRILRFQKTELDHISQVKERCCLDLLTTLEDLEDFGAQGGLSRLAPIEG
jgi:hypothetical protein